jgi:hypothetical protein
MDNIGKYYIYGKQTMAPELITTAVSRNKIFDTVIKY